MREAQPSEDPSEREEIGDHPGQSEQDLVMSLDIAANLAISLIVHSLCLCVVFVPSLKHQDRPESIVPVFLA